MPKGAYSPDVTYGRLHVVTYRNTIYCSKQEGNTGHEPVGEDEWWSVLVDGQAAYDAAEAAQTAAQTATTAADNANGSAESARSAAARAQTAASNAEQSATAANNVNATLAEDGTLTITDREGHEASINIGEGEKVKELVTSMERVKESLGHYTARPDIVLTPSEQNVAISADGVKVAKTG